MFMIRHAMFRRVLRLLATTLLCVVLAAGAAAQDEAPAAQDEAPAAQDEAPAAQDEAPGGGREKFQVRLDLLDVLAQARQAVRAGELKKAIALYQFILRFAPDFRPAKIELSIALAMLGERDRAARLLRDVDREGLDSGVIAAIDQILGPDRLRFFLIPDFIYDDNINGQTKKDVIIVNGLPFVLSEDAKGRRNYGYGLTFGAAYRLLDDAPRTTLTLGTRVRDLTARQDDTLDLFGSLSFAFRAGERGVVTPSLSGAYRTKADARYEVEQAGGIATIFPLGPVRTTLGGTYRVIEGLGDWKDLLDRRRSEVDLGLGYGFSGLGIRFDGGLFREDWQDRETLDNEGFETGLDFTFVKTPWVRPTLGGSLQFTGYENEDPFFNVTRLDREYEGHVEFVIPAFEVFGGAPVFRYTYTHATSNIPLFEYNEHGFSVGFRAITW